MQNYVFRSRRGAIVFALVAVVGALAVVGGEDDPGSLVSTSDDIVAQRKALQDEMDAQNASVGEADSDDEDVEEGDWDDEDDSEYLDDEHLIDSAEGYDPTPGTDDDDTGDFDSDE